MAGLSENNRDTNNRLIGIDIFRIFCMILVCAFHSYVHLGCQYGPILQPVVNMGAMSMTGFFMVSGFVLARNYSFETITSSDVWKYYKRRLIATMPMYWIVSVVYIFTQHNYCLRQDLILIPIETFGIQSFFSSLRAISHNGGTWFISCLLFCYLIFPLIDMGLLHLTRRHKIVAFCIVGGLLIYSEFIPDLLDTYGIYDNPYFRMFEFMLGMILAMLCVSHDGETEQSRKSQIFFSPAIQIIILIIYIVGVDLLYNAGWAIGDFTKYNVIGIPVYSILLLSLSGTKIRNMAINRFMRYCSSLAYCFFMAQFFSNWISGIVIGKLRLKGNGIIVALAWISCIVITICMHFVEIQITRFLRKRLMVEDIYT